MEEFKPRRTSFAPYIEVMTPYNGSLALININHITDVGIDTDGFTRIYLDCFSGQEQANIKTISKYEDIVNLLTNTRYN